MAAEAPSACKFCACTERRACRLIEVQISPDLDPLILPPGRTDALVTAPAFCRIVPCQWIQPDVCSNPLCVEKAYLEARELAEELTIRQQIRGNLVDPAMLDQAIDWFVNHGTEYP